MTGKTTSLFADRHVQHHSNVVFLLGTCMSKAIVPLLGADKDSDLIQVYNIAIIAHYENKALEPELDEGCARWRTRG